MRWEFFAAFLLAYLAGCIQAGYLIARAKGVDIRAEGSGSTGTTNVGRVLGFKWGVLVALLDLSKGAGSVLLGAYVFGIEGFWLAFILMAAALGHVYPAFFGFKGGKGVLALIGGLAVLTSFGSAPFIAPAIFGCWAAMLFATRLMSLANLLLFGVGVPLGLYFSYPSWEWPLVGFGMFLFIAWTHRENIRRLVEGKETKLRTPKFLKFFKSSA